MSMPANTDSDWTVTAADTIEAVVGGIRDKTAVPLETIARGLVYGIVVGVMASVAIALATIASVRALESYLPTGNVWLPYLILGSVFTLAGLMAWTRRRPRRS